MKTLLFLLLFSSAAYGQNLFTMDSSKVLTVPDTVTVGALRLGYASDLGIGYFHRGNASLKIALHDVPSNVFLGSCRTVSIPTVANGLYTGTIDSTASTTLNVITPAGDTLSTASFIVYFAHTQIAFLGGIGGNPLDNFLVPGVTMVFLKQ